MKSPAFDGNTWNEFLEAIYHYNGPQHKAIYVAPRYLATYVKVASGGATILSYETVIGKATK